MDTEVSKRTRSSNDEAQALPNLTVKRPTLLGRTASAPADGLYTLDGCSGAGNSFDRPAFIEETEIQSPILSSDKPKPTCVSQNSDEATKQKTDIPLVNLAVVGPPGVGKSTFIQCALDLKRLPDSHSSAKKMALEGAVYAVCLFEIPVRETFFDENGRVVWPRSMGDQTLPTFDGVLVLYDATNPRSILESSRMLNALDEFAIPFVLVACKCDVPQFFQSDSISVEQAGKMLRRYESHGTSIDSPRTQKRCISLVLRSIIWQTSDTARLHQSGDHYNPSTPFSWTEDSRAGPEVPNVVTSSTSDKQPIPPNQHVDWSGSNRIHDSDETENLTVAPNASTARYGRSNSSPVQPKTPPTGAWLNSRRPSSPGEISPPGRQNPLRTTWRHSAGFDAFNSFLNMEEEPDDLRSRPGSLEPSKGKSDDHGSSEIGVTFDELVDRLISLPMSKHDSKFAVVFLCLYRKFAAPFSLLNGLICRFDKNERSGVAQLTRTADQLRLLNIVAHWASEYPEDFTHSKTRRTLLDFILALEQNHVYMFAAKDISSHLEVMAEEDDTGWPFRDSNVNGDGGESFLDTSTRSSPSPLLTRTSTSDDTLNMSSLDLSEDVHDMSSENSTTKSNSSVTDRSGSVLTRSSSTLIVDAPQRDVQMFELTQRYLLTKIQWRQFMEIPDDDFARELTRIDWTMYSSFGPRDLVRHVSISGQEKDNIRSLAGVNRMVKQFNHLAFFVASMVLLRDKPKHRARALEKFINIAQKLRRQNNYNSLGAVIAGINGTPVQRLAQTRDLIPPTVQKEFMRLIILMGTQKGHFAYRLAWDNSYGERIPFLPLHRRDLVSAEEGNKTFVGENGDRISWKKFEIMGDIVLGIQRSQRTPYPHMPKNEDVLRLILDTKPMHDEEDLYVRSMQLEPSAAGAEAARKKFGWLRN